MIAKILEALFTKLINKERLISQVVAFSLGAACSALGAKTDVVMDYLCADGSSQEQSQREL